MKTTIRLALALALAPLAAPPARAAGDSTVRCPLDAAGKTALTATQTLAGMDLSVAGDAIPYALDTEVKRLAGITSGTFHLTSIAFHLNQVCSRDAADQAVLDCWATNGLDRHEIWVRGYDAFGDVTKILEGYSDTRIFFMDELSADGTRHQRYVVDMALFVDRDGGDFRTDWTADLAGCQTRSVSR